MGSQSYRDLVVWQKGGRVVLDGLSDLLVLTQERVVRFGSLLPINGHAHWNGLTMKSMKGMKKGIQWALTK